MKKLLTFLLCVPVVFLMNCGSDDETDHLANIVGTWMMTLQANSGCNDSAYNGTFDVDNSSSILVTVNANGTYTITQCGATVESGDVLEVTATTMNLCETGETDCVPEAYVITGNTITITDTEAESSGDMAGCITSVTLERDRDPADFLDPLVGTWTMTSIVAENCDDAGTQTCDTDCPTVTFSANCTYTFDDGETTPEVGVVIVNDTQILICDEQEDVCDFNEADTYTLDGNTLMVMTSTDSDFPGCDVTYTLTKQ